MFDRQHTLINALILLVGLAAWQAALAGKPGTDTFSVISAYPADADQGVTDYGVTISGSGFEAGNVESVRFLLPCSRKTCTETGGVDVTYIDNETSTDKEIKVRINVADTAVVDFRDIEVRMKSGRGGKGTTLFSVKEKTTGSTVYTTCEAEYFGGKPGETPIFCTDVNGGDCDLVVGNPDRIKVMTEDCITHATIVLPYHGAIWSDGLPGEYRTLTAVVPFVGDSVIANSGNDANVRYLNLVVGSGVATAVDCDSNPEGYLATGIRFVLDGDTPAPVPVSGAYILVNEVNISTLGDPLCEAIVVARDGTYDPDGDYPDDWKVYVTANTIQESSYARTGIRLEGFRQQTDINPPTVDRNFVGAPACSDSAVGILYGPLDARDSAVSSEALIEFNTVIMQGASCSDTTGIRLLGRGATDLNGNIDSNTVAGGRIGVEIDVDTTTDSVNMKGNTLSGDGDAGVCTNIKVDEKGKPNHIDVRYAFAYKAPPCDGN